MTTSPESTAPVTVRDAQPQDVPAIHALILELAAYERLLDAVVATEDDLMRTLFGDDRVARAMVAEVEGAAVGMALWFRTYSTFEGRPGLWLEDLYVQPALRGRGIGKALLSRLARRAVEEGCARLEWTVLDWNEPALRFYASLGAQPMDEWTTQRLRGDALRHVASLGSGEVGNP